MTISVDDRFDQDPFGRSSTLCFFLCPQVRADVLGSGIVDVQAVVSVLIPSYNRAYCLARAIDSVLNQTYPGCHAVVIDDGSTDSTDSLLADRYGGNPRVQVLRQSNQGVSIARNLGLANASGDFIGFLDSDDQWDLDKAAMHLACFERLPEVGMICSDMAAVTSDGDLVQQRYLRTMYGNYRRYPTQTVFENCATLENLTQEPGRFTRNPNVYWGDIFSAMVTGSLVHTSTVLMRRERALRAGPFDASFRCAGEDHDYHLRVCREGPVAFIDCPTIRYCVGHPDRLTRRSHMVYAAENFLRTMDLAFERDRDRIHVPRSILRSAYGEAHGWLASELFETGDMAGTRRHALQSLARAPLESRRTWTVLAAASMPAQLRERLTAVYRRIKRRALRLHDAGG
ncbi:MAG: glycosyltransferase family 2 protein [Burkholderiaceae bacterium]